MSKSVLYAVNTQTQTTLATGTTIAFPSIVRKYGCNVYLSGGNVITKGCGYYEVDTNITFTPTQTGTAIITIYKDGVAIPGATTSISVATGDAYQVSIPAITRQLCDCEKTITVVISGVATSVDNAGIVVEKL